jgi:hypothetical protein
MVIGSQMNLYVAGFWALLIVLSILAWLERDRTSKGASCFRSPELSVVALCWIAAVLTIVFRLSVDDRFSYFDHSLLVIDLSLFAGFATVGVRSGKGWVLCAAALQLLSTAAHVTRLTTPGMWRLGYQVMEEASSYPVLALLGYGIWHRHRIARSAWRSRNSSEGRRANN